jgi:uncharacterized protein (DUF779 family)
MPRYDERIPTPDIRRPLIVVSRTASAALLKLRHDRGPQVIMLGTCCATVSIVQVADRRDFDRREYHVMLGVVAHCPVYADIRHIELCPHDTLVVDLQRGADGGRPAFVTRPESTAEQQQRVFAECAHASDFR